jgi:hypothetical protein
MMIYKPNKENTPIKFTDFKTSFGIDEGLESKQHGTISSKFGFGKIGDVVVFLIRLVIHIKLLQHAVRVGAYGGAATTIDYGVVSFMHMLHANQLLIDIVELALIILFCITIAKLIAEALVECSAELKDLYNRLRKKQN